YSCGMEDFLPSRSVAASSFCAMTSTVSSDTRGVAVMFDTSDTGLRASQFHFSGNSKGNKSYRSVEDYVNSEAKRNYQQAIIQAVRDLYCQAEFDIEGVFEDDAITVDIAAERFFFDDRFDSDFREVCNLADLDPTRVRAGVLRMLEKFPETPP